MATATAIKTKAKTAIHPLDDRILILPNDPEERTKHGIFLPEAAKEKPMSGVVVATGPGKLNDEGKRTVVSVKKGDTVVYGKYSGTEIEIDGETYVISRESELLGVLE